jgi:hypothetical protein
MANKPRDRAIAFANECKDPKKLTQMAKNAAAQGDLDLERVILRNLYAVMPKEEPGTIEHDVWQSIYALEGALKAERGKTILLARTRQKIARDGERKTVEDLVMGKPSEGFAMLLDRGMPELTFEALALRHPDIFGEETRRQAQERLNASGTADLVN